MIKQRLNIVFSKAGPLRFISHLDLARLFQRAARRAGLPVTLSEGFTPRPKISFKRALKLGLESDSEEATFSISGWIRPDEFKKRLQLQLPEGIKISNIQCTKT